MGFFRTTGKTLFGGYLLYQGYVKYNTFVFEQKHVREGVPWPVFFFELLPLRLSSKFADWASRKEIPVDARPWVYRLYAAVTGISTGCFDPSHDPAERDRHLQEFKTLNAFFTRSGHVPVNKPDKKILFSPCDGKILDFGALVPSSDTVLSPVKGFRFSVKQLLYGVTQNPEEQELKVSKGNNLHYCVIYLSPSDNHRFYSPAFDWKVHTVRHLHGERLPVSPALVPWFRTSFVLNERYSLVGSWPHGFFSMVPVGAVNVGSVHIEGIPEAVKPLPREESGSVLSRLEKKVTDLINSSAPEARTQDILASSTLYQGAPIVFQQNSHVGHFNMGSTIVLVFEAPEGFKFGAEVGKPVSVGSKLGEIP